MTNFLGSKQVAEEVAQRAQKVVPAYKRFLEDKGLKPGEPFERLPQMDKESYALAYPFEELLADEATMDKVYQSLVQSLGRVQPIFLNYWQNIYSDWDDDPNKRILRLNLLPWPTLSQATETSIKQRGIVK